MKFKVALLQIASCGNDQEKNLAKGVQACREAKALGADLAYSRSFGTLAVLLPQSTPKDGDVG
jgi:hypothetical protein